MNQGRDQVFLTRLRNKRIPVGVQTCERRLPINTGNEETNFTVNQYVQKLRWEQLMLADGVGLRYIQFFYCQITCYFGVYFGVSFFCQRGFFSYFQSSFIVCKFKYQCEAEYLGRTNQRLEARISQYDLASRRLGSMSLSSRVTQSVHGSAIEQHFLDKPKCANNYVNHNFTVLPKARPAHHLRLFEAAHIKLHQTTLCKQEAHFIISLSFLGVS